MSFPIVDATVPPPVSTDHTLALSGEANFSEKSVLVTGFAHDVAVEAADTTTGNEPSGVVPGKVRITAVSVSATVGVQVN